jgi:AcrR family transcriptional regulator
VAPKRGSSGGDAAERVEPRPPRADARRNVAAILDAALSCLIRDPDVTVAQIATAAGVGRVTLYGHFSTRADLVDAVFQRVTGEANAVLDATDTRGDPIAALARLTVASWQIVHQYRAVLAAAQRELPAERIRGHHDRHLRRMGSLIGRGRRAGVFRTDLPQQWLVTIAYSVMHAAADDCSAGRLDAADAEQAIIGTLLAAFTPPGGTVPETPLSARNPR